MNLKKLKVSDLKKMAEERNIKNANKLKKDELIAYTKFCSSFNFLYNLEDFPSPKIFSATSAT